jgi:hypothetical protein
LVYLPPARFPYSHHSTTSRHDRSRGSREIFSVVVGFLFDAANRAVVLAAAIEPSAIEVELVLPATLEVAALVAQLLPCPLVPADGG